MQITTDMPRILEAIDGFTVTGTSAEVDVSGGVITGNTA